MDASLVLVVFVLAGVGWVIFHRPNRDRLANGDEQIAATFGVVKPALLRPVPVQ